MAPCIQKALIYAPIRADLTSAMGENAEYRDIGMRLKALREAHNMSQVTWAALHGFTPQQLNNWERGRTRMLVDFAYVLCDKHGVDLDWIYRGKEDGLSPKARKLLSGM